MKRKLFIVVLLLTANVSFSQDYLDDITKKACSCLSNLSDTINTEGLSMELGLCIINAASPYKNQLMKDFNINFNNIDKEGEELGRIIGVKMATICPDDLIKLVNNVKKKESNKITENIIEGRITAILDNKFVEFSIKDTKGKMSKYYWFTFIESTTDLTTNYKKMVDKSVKIVFITQEFFDARISEYSTFNIIKKLEIINK